MFHTQRKNTGSRNRLGPIARFRLTGLTNVPHLAARLAYVPILGELVT